jgi:hypothetical protein
VLNKLEPKNAILTKPVWARDFGSSHFGFGILLILDLGFRILDLNNESGNWKLKTLNCK